MAACEEGLPLRQLVLKHPDLVHSFEKEIYIVPP